MKEARDEPTNLWMLYPKEGVIGMLLDERYEYFLEQLEQATTLTSLQNVDKMIRTEFERQLDTPANFAWRRLGEAVHRRINVVLDQIDARRVVNKIQT